MQHSISRYWIIGSIFCMTMLMHGADQKAADDERYCVVVAQRSSIPHLMLTAAIVVPFYQMRIRELPTPTNTTITQSPLLHSSPPTPLIITSMSGRLVQHKLGNTSCPTIETTGRHEVMHYPFPPVDEFFKWEKQYAKIDRFDFDKWWLGY